MTHSKAIAAPESNGPGDDYGSTLPAVSDGSDMTQSKGVQPGVSRVWACCGVVSYLTITWVAGRLLHAPEARLAWRQQVPVAFYDRSVAVFGAAFAIDILNSLFELRTTKLDFALLPCFIKGMATTTNLLLRLGSAVVAVGPTGRIAVLQRYICWMHTTPSILLLLRLMAPVLGDRQLVMAIMWDEVMLITGAAATMTDGPVAVALAVASHAACLPVLMFIHRALKEASRTIATNAAQSATALTYYLIMAMWLAFGAVWDLAAVGWISVETEEALNLACDFCAKVVFSSSLMLSSFKSVETRREGVMRQIEQGNKQALVDELKNIIEQKGRFMSSVSHELRTPLNGIIGISEGMLSGCCGTLPDVVRRQVYIIRTSGARLLALINDVMDAAALRQNRLVLTRTRVALRALAGDVVDLTRSLAEPDVQITNLVPSDLFICGDAGRLVQVLNNLLSNAAKFTHHGTISVSAQYHDPGRHWVAVCVRDTGIGIPRHKMQSIFLPFEQADGSISRKYGGFGLGLSIVQELVRAHGGVIWARSSVSKGSCFTFVLPAWRDPSSAAAAATLPPPDVPSGPGVVVAAAPEAPPEEGAGPAGKRPVRREPSRLGWLGGEGDIPQEFADVPYDAAQLSALASSRPFVAADQQAAAAAAAAAAPAAAAMAGAAATGEEWPPAGGQRRPQRAGEQQQQPWQQQQQQQQAAAATPAVRPSYHSVHGVYQLLSVDDDHVNQTVMQSLMSSAGYELLMAGSGQEALSLLEKAEVMPDLLLLDNMMPDMSGLDVCRRLRELYPAQRLPIIMVSARVEEEAVVSGLDVGADDYITKPFKRNEFLARIRAKLEMAAGEAAMQEADGAPSSAYLNTSLTFPLSGASQPAAPGQDAPDACAAAAAAGSTASGAAGPLPVVLCVDDDEVNQLVLQGMLHSQDYGYLKARTGGEGLACFSPANATARLPDLVLVDSSLPDMKGLEFVRMLRERYTKLQLPIIILTARHHEKAIVEGLEGGANDYVTKPFRRSELMARIRMHLRSVQRAMAAASGGGCCNTSGGAPGGAAAVMAAVWPMMVAGDAEARGAAAAAAGQEADDATGSLGLNEEQRLLLKSEQQVPIIAVQMDGLDGLMDELPAAQAAALLTRLLDLGDMLVEKYAVCKVESSDCAMVLVALQGLNYWRTSLDSRKLPQAPAGVTRVPPSGSSQSLPLAAMPWTQTEGGGGGGGTPETPLAARSSCGSFASVGCGSSFHAFGQLLLLAEELLEQLPRICSEVLASREQQQLLLRGGGGGGAAAAPRPPEQLGLRIALHLGPVQAAVLGTRRPRHKVFGPAIPYARAASLTAPLNVVVATPEAAEKLQELGVAALGSPEEAAAWAAAGGSLRTIPDDEQAAASAAAAGGGGGASPQRSPTHRAGAALSPASLALSRGCGAGDPWSILFRHGGGGGGGGSGLRPPPEQRLMREGEAEDPSTSGGGRIWAGPHLMAATPRRPRAAAAAAAGSGPLQEAAVAGWQPPPAPVAQCQRQQVLVRQPEGVRVPAAAVPVGIPDCFVQAGAFDFGDDLDGLGSLKGSYSPPSVAAAGAGACVGASSANAWDALAAPGRGGAGLGPACAGGAGAAAAAAGAAVDGWEGLDESSQLRMIQRELASMQEFMRQAAALRQGGSDAPVAVAAGGGWSGGNGCTGGQLHPAPAGCGGGASLDGGAAPRSAPAGKGGKASMLKGLLSRRA